MRKVGGNGLWKFKKSLNTNSDFATKTKYNIKTVLEISDKESITDYQYRWELLKNEIKKFSMEFQKKLAKNVNIETLVLETKLKMLEITTKYDKNSEYVDCKKKLDIIYDEKINGVRNRSKCNWYEDGEESKHNSKNIKR